MILRVVRFWPSAACVEGQLSIDGVMDCFTLELTELYEGVANVPQKTCIPIGTFPVKMLPSKHFGRLMPHVLDVPGRDAIEIHPANVPSEILGCLAVGNTRINDSTIGESRECSDALNVKIQAAEDAGEVVSLVVSYPETTAITV